MKKKLVLVVSITIGSFICPTQGLRESSPLKVQDLKRVVGQLLIVGFAGASSQSPGFLNVIDNLERGIAGGVLFLPQNIVRRPELETMVRMIRQCACETMPLIAIDAEGGAVDRLGKEFRFPYIASAAEIGKASDAEARRQYAALAKKLADVGFNMNFAPVVDLNKNPRNPAIGAQRRSYSPDPGAVTRYAKIFIAEHRAAGILTALKHFPGHGSSSTDTHSMLTDVRNTWSPEELIPYQRLIEAGLADTVMVGHLANKLRWGGAATQQGSAAISQILRSELKFDGVVISDDLTMRAVLSGKSSLAQIARSSINGGVDLLLIGEPADPKIQNTGVHVNSAVMAGIESGDVATCTIKKAWQRVMSLKARLQSMQMQLNSQQTYVEGH